jgi:hypothetical protein
MVNYDNFAIFRICSTTYLLMSALCYIKRNLFKNGKFPPVVRTIFADFFILSLHTQSNYLNLQSCLVVKILY